MILYRTNLEFEADNFLSLQDLQLDFGLFVFHILLSIHNSHGNLSTIHLGRLGAGDGLLNQESPKHLLPEI